MNSMYNPYEVIVEMMELTCPFCQEKLWVLIRNDKDASEIKCMNCHAYLWEMENAELTEQFIEKIRSENI